MSDEATIAGRSTADCVLADKEPDEGGCIC